MAHDHTQPHNAAQELLRAEYVDALFSGDPLTQVSTPGLATESATLLALVLSLADAQVAYLAGQGAL